MPRGQNIGKLKDYYLKLNITYFGGVLPDNIVISMSSKLKKKAGISYFKLFQTGDIVPFEISLSERYLKLYPFDIFGVLLHEMIHIKLKNSLHNDLFLKEIERMKSEYGVDVPIVGKIC